MRFAFIIGSLLLVHQHVCAQPSPQQMAAEVDRLLIEKLAAENVTPAPIARDEDFLRRVYLDLAGVVPTPKEVTLFGLNPDPQKRSKMIASLLNAEEFGQYWGSYWREVVMSRATDQRARLVLPAFEAWLVEQLNANRPWDDITRDLLTATGEVSETGETGLIFAHTGQPEELAAEVSRIFLGIQMSCANCHHHPTDSWKREDFHQLAAFLPRISVRREDPGNPRSFAIRSLEENQRGPNGRQVDAEQLFRIMDRNRDGKLEKSEARGPLATRFDQTLGFADADKDGKLSKEEFSKTQMMANAQPGRGELEYFMPDLNNPASQGTLTQPVFFIPEVRGPKLRKGASDLTRRHALADYVTSPTNPWFAKAFVNRVWAEMLGQGFYMPVDDMGPERIAIFEDVLDVLADGFVQNQYDVKWVFQTIANTAAYQREVRSRDGDEYIPPFAVSTTTRLSSDQIFDSLATVLGTSAENMRNSANLPGGMTMRRRGANFAKLAFQQTFGVDPSTPKDEMIGNVPQALFMMNNVLVEQMTRASGETRLARILRDQSDDADALSELYLLILSRDPSPTEIEINKNYITQTANRSEAFEDIMWSLLNSTEFLSKR